MSSTDQQRKPSFDDGDMMGCVTPNNSMVGAGPHEILYGHRASVVTSGAAYEAEEESAAPFTPNNSFVMGVGAPLLAALRSRKGNGTDAEDGGATCSIGEGLLVVAAGRHTPFSCEEESAVPNNSIIVMPPSEQGEGRAAAHFLLQQLQHQCCQRNTPHTQHAAASSDEIFASSCGEMSVPNNSIVACLQPTTATTTLGCHHYYGLAPTESPLLVPNNSIVANLMQPHHDDVLS